MRSPRATLCLPRSIFLASTTDALFRSYDFNDKFRVRCHKRLELLQGQESIPVFCHVPNDKVSKATVVLLGCAVDEAYDLEYLSKRSIPCRPHTITWLMGCSKNGDTFFLCQLLQVVQIKFLSHGIHSGMEVECETEGALRFRMVIPIENIVGSVAVTYQFADQVRIILRQVNALG